jgi:ubiquinone/menaquinone biosynthesis C-methylase UbiE
MGLKDFVLSSNFMGFDLTLRKRAEFLKNVRNSYVLDVGCGSNAYLSFLMGRQGNRVLGVDRDEGAIKSARQRSAGNERMQFKVIDARRLNSLDEKFDCAVCMEVIEHIKDDEKLLRDLCSLLKKGGLLILSTVNRDSWLAKKCSHDISEEEDGGHVRDGYGKKELEEKLKRNGFVVEESTSCIGGITQRALALEYRLRKPKLLAYNTVFRALIFPFLYSISLFDSSKNNPEDMTLVVMARKK